MAYCAWTDVVTVFPEATDIEATGADQLAIIAKAQELTDAWLSPLMRTPIQADLAGAYPALVVEICALLAADHTAWRNLANSEETYEVEHDTVSYTLTRYGHRALGYVQALARQKAALADEATAPDVNTPLIERTFTTTNGVVTARFSGGIYRSESDAAYVFTIESTGGTVAGDDLTVSVKRDGDTELWTSASPMAVNGTGWHRIEHGLEVRFVDALTSPAWTNAETFKVSCETYAQRVQSGLRTVEVHLG